MDALDDLLKSVNDWLKFAETKNAVLLLATGAAIWGAARLIILEQTGCYLSTYLLYLEAFLLAAFLTALVSFLPILNYRWIVSKPTRQKTANGNILFFAYLAGLSTSQLISEFRTAVSAADNDLKQIDQMYAEQIIINSRIALAKFSMFELSVKFVLYGVLTPLIAFPLLHLSKKKCEGIDGI